MLFHAAIPGFSGGFIGVDVFFVISGFVITSVIVADLERSQFSFFGFYTRRVRRIIPALALITLLCVPAAWFLMVPHEIMDLSETVAAVAAFASNILFWLHSNYFAPDAHLNPLLHSWSLAVEEQFYLLFPILFVLLWRFAKQAVLPVLLVVLAGSFIAAQVATTQSPAGSFFLTPFRIWELLAGACATLGRDRFTSLREPNTLLATVGAVLVIGSILLLRPDSGVPGIAAAPAVIGTVLLLLFSSAGMRGNGLAHPVAVRIGLISYSLYLWHQPLLAFGRVVTLDRLSLGARVALLIASFPLAYLSWRFVEIPFRDRRRVSVLAVWAVAGSFTIAAIAIGIAGTLSWGFYDAKLRSVAPEMRRFVIDRPRELERRTPIWDAALAEGARPFGPALPGGRILILGDSKAEDLNVATRMQPALFGNLSIREVALDDPCMAGFAATLERRSNHPDSPGDCLDQVRKLTASRLIDSADTIVLAAMWERDTYAGGVQLAEAFRRAGKRVIVIGEANFHDPSSLSMRLARAHLTGAAAEHYLWENKLESTTATGEKLRALVATKGDIEYRSALDLYCNDAAQRCAMFDAQGHPIEFDSGHVTVEGARFVGKRLADLGWLIPR